ncbi:hypothetical protein UlMin_042230 [Ulmus minor]
MKIILKFLYITVMETQKMTSNASYTLTEDQSQFLNSASSFMASDYSNSSPKQEVFQSKTPMSITSSKSSSPSTLGLPLRSSIFRELVEKNSNVLEEETDEEEIKNQGLQVGSEDDEYGRFFFEGIGDVPFVCSSNKESIELQKKELHYML